MVGNDPATAVVAHAAADVAVIILTWLLVHRLRRTSKAYNDQYGHLAGDELLRCLADGLGALLPATAAPARWGGEEFVVALPDLSAAEAHAVAERIRTKDQGRDRVEAA